MQNQIQNCKQKKNKSIGNYIIGKTLGEGTFGKVKLATHTITGQNVAIKILQKKKIVDVSDVQRVSRQIHILKLIRHPNIIQLYEIIQTQKQLFLVMEYVSGGQLFDYIVNKKRLKEAQACKIFLQIINGVEYIHSLKVVHRDLKPENLLIDFNQSIKIVDFGLSNTYNKIKTDQVELLKTACGSPCYAAPEMIAGKKYAGLGVDIWSCGVILFAMVCGFLPFEDPNTSCLYKKILAGEYSLPKFISSDLKDFFKGILNTEPGKRMTIDQIRSHKWTQLIKINNGQGIIIGFHRIPIDTKSMDQISDKLSIDKDFACKCLQSNKHNHITTAYYLKLKKKLKEGENNQYDLNSEKFNHSLIQPKKQFKQPRISSLVKQLYEDQHKSINLNKIRSNSVNQSNEQGMLTTGKFFPKKQQYTSRYKPHEFIIKKNPYKDQMNITYRGNKISSRHRQERSFVYRHSVNKNNVPRDDSDRKQYKIQLDAGINMNINNKHRNARKMRLIK